VTQESRVAGVPLPVKVGVVADVAELARRETHGPIVAIDDDTTAFVVRRCQDPEERKREKVIFWEKLRQKSGFGAETPQCYVTERKAKITAGRMVVERLLLWIAGRYNSRLPNIMRFYYPSLAANRPWIWKFVGIFVGLIFYLIR